MEGPVRRDGELELPDGGGVNWREMAMAARGGSEVLVKTMRGVHFRRVTALFTAAPAS